MSKDPKRLYATDETYREVANLLFGGGADDLVAKFASNPDQRQRKVTAGLSATGATAGAVGLGYAARNTAREFKATPKAMGTVKRIKTTVKADKVGTALIPLEVAGLGGEMMATKILHNDTKKQPVAKSEPGSSDVHSLSMGKLKRTAAKKGFQGAKKAAPVVRRGALKAMGDTRGLGNKVLTHTKNKVEKARGPKLAESMRNIGEFYRDDPYGRFQAKVGKLTALGATTAGGSYYGAKKANEVKKSVTFEGEFSKVDSDKRQVFGWASIVEINGEPVVDLQGDYIDHDELEKSAYDYVIKSRKGGDMHTRNGEEPLHVSDMIESFLVTPEKKKALNLPDEMPTGWWVGYQINDDEAWNLVKSGKRTGFSIHGRGQRTETEM